MKALIPQSPDKLSRAFVAAGELSVEWFDPKTGKATPSEKTAAGAARAFAAPFAGDAVL